MKPATTFEEASFLCNTCTAAKNACDGRAPHARPRGRRPSPAAAPRRHTLHPRWPASSSRSASISDPPPYIDGKSQGCRFLHAVFAAENEAHCPHISLIPIKDINDKTVCQESALNPVLMGSPGSPFTVAEKEFFEDFMSKRGIPEMGYKVNPTVPCGSAEDCPAGLVCETTGGRRLRFGAVKTTGVCVDLRT